MTVSEVIEAVRRLSPDEQAQVRELLNRNAQIADATKRVSDEAALSPDDTRQDICTGGSLNEAERDLILQQRLFEMGLLSEVKYMRDTDQPSEDEEAVPILGEPISTTVIEGRR